MKMNSPSSVAGRPTRRSSSTGSPGSRDALPVDRARAWSTRTPTRLALVAGVSQADVRAGRQRRSGSPRPPTVVAGGVRRVDAVLIQLRVGGQAARHGDETFPHACGCIGQETTGPGGLAKALRTVPVVLDVADAVRRHARPDAWIVDFTNPVGIVTRALLEDGHRRGRAVQRGDRLPAPVRRACSASEPDPRSRSTTSGSTT